MSQRAVAIFSDDETGPLLAEAARRVGYEPHFFFSFCPTKPWDYPWYKVDPYLPPEQLADTIKGLLGTPMGIVSCIEQLSVNLAKTAELLQISYSPVHAFEILRDKSLMKSVWAKAGVRTPVSCLIRQASDLDQVRFEYPLIVKPTHGAASAGVRIVDDEEMLKKQMKQIFRFIATTLGAEQVEKPGILIEEYIDGDEYSVDTLWLEGIPLLNGIMSKGNPQGPTFPDRLYYTDPYLNPQIEEELLRLSHAAVSSAGIYSGATHTEIRMRNHEGFVLEAALRPGAGACFYEIFEKAYGIPFYEALIILSLGRHSEQDLCRLEEISRTVNKASSRLYWYNMAYRGHGIISSISGADEILSQPYVDKIAIRKKPGDYLSPESESYAYLGWIIGEMPKAVTIEHFNVLLEQMEQSIQICYKTS